MASVHVGTDERLDRVVAIKIMHPGLGDDDDFTARFVREARSAAKLNHPNIVSVFDQGEDQGFVYLVMEYVPGQTLRDVMRAETPMPASRALSLLEQLLVALSAAHEARIVHRDVKPENVLIAPDGRIKVADFGLARAVSASTAATATGGVLIGTISYLAPELVTNQGSDARTDVYACGALLYEMLTGRKPHEGESPIQVAYKHVHEDIPEPSAVRPDIPPYIDALVARATARDRNLRSADARVLLQQVRQARAALDQGLDDDLELTQDLRPRRSNLAVTPITLPESVETLFARPADAHGDSTVVVTSASSSGKTSSRRRGPVLLILVIVLAVLAAIGGWYYGVGRFTETPRIIGLTHAEGRQEAVKAGFEFDVSKQSFSETVTKGDIITTDPRPGAKILPDSTINAVVSKGKERYAVPDLAGKTEDQATDILAERKLAVGDVETKYSETVASGQVISTVLKPKTSVKRDTDVDLVISKGRRPIKIVDYTGKSSSDAADALRKAGLKVDVSRVFSGKVDKEAVISQDPESGTRFKKDVVKLTVSKGPAPVAVPRVVGRGTDSAKKSLEKAGFKVKVKKDGSYIGFGIVVRQDPARGDKALPGSTVTIAVV